MLKNRNRMCSLALTMITMLSIFCPVFANTAAEAANTKITGWTFGISNNADASCELDSEVKLNGGMSAHMKNNSSQRSNVYAVLKTPVSVEKGKTYVYSFWAKAYKASGIGCNLSFNERKSLTPVGGTYDWTHFSFEYTHTGGNTSLTFQFLLENRVKDFWVDDVEFYEKGEDGNPTGKNLISNSGFEADFSGTALDTEAQKIRYANMTGNNFDYKQYMQTYGCVNYAPVLPSVNITVDGSLDDWENSAYGSVQMPSTNSQLTVNKEYSGKDDIYSSAKIAYDSEYIYFGIEVTDDIHFPVTDPQALKNMWRGDSVQIVLSEMIDSYGTEYIFAYSGDGVPYIYQANCTEEQLKTIKFNGARADNKTIYEIAIPWKLDFEAVPKEMLFDMVFNDNDGDGRDCFLELAPGVTANKSNRYFPKLTLVEKSEECFAWTEGDKTVYENNDNEFFVYIYNPNETSVNVNVDIAELNFTKSVELPPKKTVRQTIPITLTECGSHNAGVSVKSANGSEIIVNHEFSIIHSAEYYEEKLNKFKSNNLPKINKLLKQCESAKIPTDYETVNYTVMQRFTDDAIADAADGKTELLDYVLRCLNELYDEAKNNLENYLNNNKRALVTPRYITGNTELENRSIIGNTSNAITGKEKQRTVFMTGYGHFKDVRTDIPNFKGYGTNIIQIELGPQNVLRKGSNGEFNISNYDLTNDICKTLENAEKNNIAVNLLLSPHYFPSWITQMFPEVKHGNDGGFIKYNIYSEKAKEAIELYLRTVIPAVKDYKSLHSICLSNEPVFYSNLDEYNLTFWHDYLKEMYTDVNELNSVYGTAYTSFDEVPMPSDVEGSAHFYDWMVFNNRMFADWHSWMADIVHELAPDIPLHSKVMNMLEDDGRHRKFLKNGTDPEMFAEFSDYMGCDASNYFYQNIDGSGSGIITKMKWYDLLESMKNAPVFNSEDHIISIDDNNFGSEGAEHFNSDLWQGAIHGRSAATLWVWAKDTTGKQKDRLLERPDIVAAVGKTNLDLNRLSNEVTAFQNQKAETAILYSMTAWTYSKQYMDALDKAYRAAVYSGQKVRFVTEKQIKEGQLKDIKVLLVPDVKNAWETTLTGVDEFIQNGGKTIILGNDAFTNDEHNKPLSADVRDRVMKNATVIPIETDGKYTITAPLPQEVRKEIFKAYSDSGTDGVMLIDETTGEPVYDVEWRCAEYNGKLHINMCNYNWKEPKKIRIEINGKKANVIKEIIKNEKLNDASFELQPFSPKLITAEIPK